MLRPHVLQVAGEFGSTEYSGRNAPSERMPEKGDIFLRLRELLASSFGPRLCGKKNHNGRKSPGCPDIAVYGPHHAGPGRVPPNCDRCHRQPSKKTRDASFESLTTRLRPRENAGREQETEK
jgi:hypothetical protein